MTARRVSDPDEHKSSGRPATTPEGREQELIVQAVNLAERQIQNGTASAQVISHYLKLGSSREKLEQARMAAEQRLLEAKVEALASQARMEELYGEAIRAMGNYSGRTEEAFDV